MLFYTNLCLSDINKKNYNKTNDNLQCTMHKKLDI